MLVAPFWDERFYPKPAQEPPCGFRIVRSIGIKPIGSRSRRTPAPAHLGNIDNQRKEFLDVVRVRAGSLDLKRNSIAIGEHMMLASRFPPIGGVWTGFASS